jgi:transcriptional regulator EpsA
MPFPHIAPEQSECLLRVMEAAPQVCRRHQFFVWSQGDFQRWLPHNVILCGAYDRDQRDVVFDLFNSLPLPEELSTGLRQSRSDFMRQALQGWRKGQHQASRVSLHDLAQASPQATSLLDMGYEQLLVHGLTRPGRADELESFFIFMQPRQAYSDDAVQALDMLLPSVHLTYQRVCVTERQMQSGRNGVPAQSLGSANGAPARGMGITEREREILRWVRDGMSNQQISDQLGISALTVKNHVQKILRKLGAANRAQAVAKAMSMNAFGNATSTMGDFQY